MIHLKSWRVAQSSKSIEQLESEIKDARERQKGSSIDKRNEISEEIKFMESVLRDKKDIEQTYKRDNYYY